MAVVTYPCGNPDCDKQVRKGRGAKSQRRWLRQREKGVPAFCGPACYDAWFGVDT